jgi:hypothetical protein
MIAFLIVGLALATLTAIVYVIRMVADATDIEDLEGDR